MEDYFYLETSIYIFATNITVKPNVITILATPQYTKYLQFSIILNLFNNDSYCNYDTAVGHHRLCLRSHSWGFACRTGSDARPEQATIASMSSHGLPTATPAEQESGEL